MEIMIHHIADNDGQACAAVFKHYNPNGILVPWNYGWEGIFESLEEVGDGATPYKDVTLYIADVSFDYDTMCELTHEYGNVVWIDHHNSAYREFMERGSEWPWQVVFDDKVSACELCWSYFVTPSTIHRAIELIGKRDIWKKDEDWEESVLPFHAYLSNNFGWEAILEILKDEWGSLELASAIEKGSLYMQRDRYHFKYISDKYRVADLLGYNVLVVNTPIGQSDIPELIYEEFNTGLVVCYYQNKYGNWNYSIRVAPWLDVDASEIAKVYGGGGHAKAAGFQTEKLIF